MGKKSTKAVSLVLCLLMLTSVTACSQKDSGATDTSPTSNGSTSSKADPFGKYSTAITLTTVRSLDSNVKFDTSKPAEKSLTENVWATAYEEKLGIKFDYLWTPNTDQYDSKWNVAIAAGDIPDCAVVDSTIYKQLINSGLEQDMTKYYNDYASDMYKQGNKDDGGVTMNYMTFDGKLQGLPCIGTSADGVNFLFIRKDWLKKVNMTEPKTIDDLINVANAFKKAKLGGKDTYGICMSKSFNAGQNDMGGIFNSFGAYYDIWTKDSTGGLVYSTIQPAMRTSILKLQEMYKDGLINQDFAVKDASTAGNDVAAGKVGMLYGQFWAPAGGAMSNMTNDPSADWEVIVPPTSNGSTYVSQASQTPSSYIFVNKNCKTPEAVVKLLNLNLKLESEDPVTYSNNGVDQVEIFNYRFAAGIFLPWKNLKTHNAIVAARKSGDTSNLSATDKSWYDEITQGLTSKGTAFNKTMNLLYGDDSCYTLINNFKKNNQILVDAHQALPTDTQLAKGDTLKTSLDAAMQKVIMGDDISTFDKAVSAWKQSGGDTITSEVNAWYTKNK
jgi:putative aldouronate transport system substrate-binding protein